MNVKSVEKQEKSAVQLVIEIGGEEFEAAVQKAYLKQRSKINVPGFRKGKAPRKIIEGMFGSGVFYEDAINELYPKAYAEAVEQEKLDVVSWPNVEVVEAGKDGLTFKATVTVRPEVKLGEYKGLTAEKEEVKLTDEDIEGELKPYINRATRMVTVEREAQNGDTVVIDFEGFKDGVPFDGGKAEGHSLELGSSAFIPGFEDQLVGTKAGDEKDVNVTFPEDYHAEDLAGAPVVFKVKVHEVKEKKLPELDDEFAKDVSEFETLADFKKDLGEKLQQRRTAEAQNDFESAVLDQLIDNLEADIPDGMVETQLDKIMDEYAMRMSGQGMSMDDYLKMMGMTPEMLRASAKPSALRQVKTQLALEAVAAAENMEVTEEECEAEVSKLAEQYKLTPEQVKAAVSVDALKQDLLLQKASKLVVDEAKVGEAPKKEEAAEEKPKKTTRKKKTEEAAGEEQPAEEKPKRTRKKKTEESAEEPKAE